MRSVSVRLDDLKTTVINIGFVGENEHTRVQIDAKKMYDQYPNASVSMTVSPPEGEAYPAVVERDGDLVIWDVVDSNLVHEGSGEIQLSFVVDEVVAKSYIGRIRISRSIMPTGEIPEPIDDWITRADAALTAIPEEIGEALDDAFGDITAYATTLEPGSSATANFDPATKSLTIGVPEGEKGDTGAAGRDGTDGRDGVDGFSPVATVTKSGKVATISITDKNGTTSAEVSDGADGTDIIDDTAGAGDTDKAWSADKLTTDLGSLMSAINGKYTKPQTGIPASDLASGVIPSVPVQDVQVNGTSILSQGVANVPKCLDGNGVLGVVQVNSTFGIGVNSSGRIYIGKSSSANVKDGTNEYRPVVPSNQHESTFYGLAKAAGNSDQSSSSNAVGVYTDDAKLKIQQMFGLWTPKCYKKFTVEEDVQNTGDISFDVADYPINVYEELVIVVYQSISENGQAIASNNWSYIMIRDVINDTNFGTHGACYFNGSKAAVARFKRYPGVLFCEVMTGNSYCGTYSLVRTSDYVDKIRRFTMASSGGTVKAGTTLEAYIHRFI